jgi:hypothetical protein
MKSETHLYNPHSFYAHPDISSTVEIEVINICDVLDLVDPNWMNTGAEIAYEEQGRLVREYAEEIGAVIYCRPRESFFIREACQEAYEAGRSKVIVEDLS